MLDNKAISGNLSDSYLNLKIGSSDNYLIV